VTGRVLLVGDAAGLVQPLFGEGIQYAVRSGAQAAIHIASDTVSSYADSIRTMFGGEFDAANRVAKLFHRTPYLSYKLGVKNPAGTKLVGRLMSGDLQLEGIEQRIMDKLRPAAITR
jgi:flavin-dependent dehydrogenase